MNKREFIKSIALTGLSLPFVFEGQSENNRNHFPDQSLPDDEFWAKMREQYHLTNDYINLENGYYSIMPKDILSHYLEKVKTLNLQGSHYMRTEMDMEKENVRKTLADFLECPVEEIIITRNTTESMDTVISGIDWQKGDEAVMAAQDYGAMLDMFKQMGKRYGVINKIISVPLHPKSDEEIVDLYQKSITSKTKLIMVSHMINTSGQILPVRKICDMAHQQGVKVLVDGAHAIAHFAFKIKDLNCDFYASSLHKWLSNPLGAGLLYVKKEHIPALWPLYGESGFSEDDIRKLNHMGTGPIHALQSIPYAIEFHKKIGDERKEKRLRFLQTYWTSQLRGLKNIRINTPVEDSRNCGIANVGLDNFTVGQLSTFLIHKCGIWTVGIDNAGVQGCRITPNIYTTTKELDILANAIKAAAKA